MSWQKSSMQMAALVISTARHWLYRCVSNVHVGIIRIWSQISVPFKTLYSLLYLLTLLKDRFSAYFFHKKIKYVYKITALFMFLTFQTLNLLTYFHKTWYILYGTGSYLNAIILKYLPSLVTTWQACNL